MRLRTAIAALLLCASIASAGWLQWYQAAGAARKGGTSAWPVQPARLMVYYDNFTSNMVTTSTLTDLSGNGWHATSSVNNAGTFIPAYSNWSAIQYDTTDFYQIPTNAYAGGKTSLTVVVVAAHPSAALVGTFGFSEFSDTGWDQFECRLTSGGTAEGIFYPYMVCQNGSGKYVDASPGYYHLGNWTNVVVAAFLLGQNYAAFYLNGTNTATGQQLTVFDTNTASWVASKASKADYLRMGHSFNNSGNGQRFIAFFLYDTLLTFAELEAIRIHYGLPVW